jgi:hypothetical protein
VLSRRLEPLNRERVEWLDRLEAECGERGPDVTRIVESFIAPALRMKRAAGEEGTRFMRLVGHAMQQSNDQIRELLTDRFRDTVERYTAALSRALPHLAADEILLRLLFCVGSMVHALVMFEHLQHKYPAAGLDLSDVDGMTERMVRFLSAGFEAPATGSGVGGEA